EAAARDKLLAVGAQFFLHVIPRDALRIVFATDARNAAYAFEDGVVAYVEALAPIVLERGARDLHDLALTSGRDATAHRLDAVDGVIGLRPDNSQPRQPFPIFKVL